MINLLAVWLILFAILLGGGLAILWTVRRVARESFGGALSVFQTVWLGYAGLLCFLQLASLGLRIGEVVIVLACVPALAGFVLQRRAVMRRLRQLRTRTRVCAVIAVLVVITSCIVAWSACDIPRLYDTGLYHLQTVKWSTEYPTVPGLANLHMRFGYNNSVHLFGAFTDAFWQGVAVHIANGFFLIVALAQWLTEIFMARTPRGRIRQLFCMFTLPFLLAKLWTMEVASLSSDLPLAVFSFVLVLELISLPRARTLLPLISIVSLAAVVVSTKLGGLAMFVVTGGFALLVLRRVASDWRARATLLALPVLIVVGWIVRGVIMSGWLLYPVFGRLPLAWAVPKAIAADDLGNIESWSRVFGKPPAEVFGHGFWHWFSPWLEVFRTSQEFIMLVVACALLAWRVAHAPPQTGRTYRAAEWFAAAACVLGIVQWFVGAPDLRYGGYLFWLLPAVLLVPLLAGVMRDATMRTLVLVLALAFATWAGAFRFHQFALPKLWGRPPAPQRVKTERRSIGPATEVYVPAAGDQCFDEPLPCTPMIRAQQRDSGSHGAGYLPAP